MNDYTNLTLTELADALNARETSAVELTSAFLMRMTQKEPEVNAYITPTAQTALQQAIRADAMLRAGEHSYLCGIPYAAKDNLAVRGIQLTCASEMLRDFVPEYTSVVCERAEACGGVLLGKTNLDEFAMGSSTERSIIGATHNPLNLTRSAGGSSGGSAAAVAAGEAAWALGSDTGGSARQPAAFCGLVAMKPTYGLVPRFGMVELASSLDVICPITRTVEDSALVLNAIAGRDGRDATSIESDEDYTAGLEDGVCGLRIGVVGTDVLNGCEDAVIRAVTRAARIFGTLGAEVEEVSLPLEMALEIYMVVAAAEASSNLARFDGIRYGCSLDGDSAADIMKNSRTAGFGDEVKRRIVTGSYALSSTYGGGYYKKIKTAQRNVCEMTRDILEKYDLVLIPTAAGAAFPLGAYADDPTALYRSDQFTTIANLTGVPAIQIPGGGDGKLPVGISLMGRKRSEAVLYRAAYALEQELYDVIGEEVRRDERKYVWGK